MNPAPPETPAERPDSVVHPLHQYVVLWREGHREPCLCTTGWDLEGEPPAVVLRDAHTKRAVVAIVPILEEDLTRATMRSLSYRLPRSMQEP